ncbi:MAG: strictosidine synthase [Caldimonas sp.]
MIGGAVLRGLQRWRGAGEYTITLPPMDGALRANDAIESASLVLATAEPDNLARAGSRYYLSQGNALIEIDFRDSGALGVHVGEFDVPISALAGDDKGNLIAGFEDGRLRFVAGPRAGEGLGPHIAAASCPTALMIDGNSLLVCQGSAHNPPSGWKRDLMQRRASGSVWRVMLDGGTAEQLAGGIAFPYGLSRTADGAIVVAESWRHRLLALGADGSTKVLLDGLPGYPARLAPASDGGHWLCIFAPRSRLVEFTLTERDFCADMLLQLEPEHWIAPALSSGQSFLEPLQGGGVKQMGILKPWAPSLSYGLLAKLDVDFQLRESFHSRAGGTRHGITSCIEHSGRVLVASRGGNALVALPTGDEQTEAAP